MVFQYSYKYNKVKFLLCYNFLFSLVLCSFIASAQVQNENIDPKFGLNPVLYNGKVYYFFPQPGTVGSQYMYTDFDPKGAILIRGIAYSNHSLNYDIYNQQVILKYVNQFGSTSMIEISNAWLEKFEIYGSQFELFSEADTTKRIYQVLGDHKFKVLYYRKKDLLLDNMKTIRNHYFTDVKRDMFVLFGNRIISYNSNRSFVRIFDESKRDLIKKYAKAKGIRVKSANDQKMNDLVNYCSSLYKL